ncbi:MAG: methylmalonyl-CoA mutase [Opitutaceae bacterium]|nr:methylmalonyl-CoA mutase [Opitutaceae bacterium]
MSAKLDSPTASPAGGNAIPDAEALRRAWRETVEKDLAGVPFEKKLVTRTAEGIDQQPLYHRGMVEAVPHRDTLPGQAPFLRGLHARGAKGEIAWRVAQPIPAATPADFNKALLAALARGQNAALLPAAYVADAAALTAALKDIHFGGAPVLASAGASAAALAGVFGTALKNRGEEWSVLQGSVTADPLAALATEGKLAVSLDTAMAELASWTVHAAANAPALKTIGVDAGWVVDAGGNSAQELAVAIAMAVEYLRRLEAAKVDVKTAAPRVAFSFAVGSQFFPELAKFRAFRLLWARVLSAFGDANLASGATLHARTALFNKTVLDPYVNMLRTTTEALSAVLGGVDSVQVGAFDEVVRTPDEFSQRIARNIALMLSEEFNFAEVADAAGGSWLVEKFTDELARKAWGLFQTIEKQGGFAAALAAGEIQKLIAASASDKRKALDTRRLAVLGTNLFPNLKEKPLAPNAVPAAPAASASAAAAVSVTPVKAWRAAEGYEALRAIADRFAKSSGKRPQVFLAKIGPVKQHKPRADFAAGFFAVGGFEAIGKEAFETPEAAAKAAVASGAPVVVLCSTDDTYPVLVPAFASALKAAKPGVIAILAGLPAEPATVEAFKQAGIDDFIHIRANVRDLLAQLLAKIGAK